MKWYKSQFPKKTTGKLIGEATPRYLFHAKTPKKLHKLYPDTKLIVLLRNPVDRAFSHYKHNIYNGREKRSFEKALEDEEKTVNEDLSQDEYSMHFSYLKRGAYLHQIKRWLKYFPKEQILFLKAEDFFKNPKKIMNKIHRFLGLDRFSLKKYVVANKGDPDIKLSDATREKLSQFFAPHNKELQDYFDNTGIDFDIDWH